MKLCNNSVGNKIVAKMGASGKMKKAGGNWVQGDSFFDRLIEVDDLSERVRAGSHTLVVGPRRMGKTSLVRETLRRLENNGQYRTFFVDIEGAEDPADAIVAIAAECRSATGKWRRAGRALRNAVPVPELQYKDFKIRLRTKIHSETWKKHGDAIFQALARQEKPSVLAIDELPLLVRRLLTQGTDDITEEGRSATDVFLSWLRQHGQTHRPNVTLIVSGSVSIEPILQQAGLTAHMNIFQPLRLDAWDDNTSSQCLATLAESYAVDLPQEVCQSMCRRLRHCVPHHVQQFFDHMLTHLRRSGRRLATLEDVETVYERDMLGPRGQADLPHYESRLRLVLNDSDYHIAMEILTEAAISDGFIANDALLRYKLYYADGGERTDFAVENILSLLTHDGYLSQTSGGYRYVSGLLEDWWRLRYGGTFVPIMKRY